MQVALAESTLEHWMISRPLLSGLCGLLTYAEQEVGFNHLMNDPATGRRLGALLAAGDLSGTRPAGPSSLSPYRAQYVTVTNCGGAQGYRDIALTGSPIALRRPEAVP